VFRHRDLAPTVVIAGPTIMTSTIVLYLRHTAQIQEYRNDIEITKETSKRAKHNDSNVLKMRQ
jgi:hypothetical protein